MRLQDLVGILPMYRGLRDGYAGAWTNADERDPQLTVAVVTGTAPPPPPGRLAPRVTIRFVERSLRELKAIEEQVQREVAVERGLTGLPRSEVTDGFRRRVPAEGS